MSTAAGLKSGQSNRKRNFGNVVSYQVSGVSSKKARTGLKPDPPRAEHLKHMLRDGFTTPDNVQKKTYFSSILRNLSSPDPGRF